MNIFKTVFGIGLVLAAAIAGKGETSAPLPAVSAIDYGEGTADLSSECRLTRREVVLQAGGQSLFVLQFSKLDYLDKNKVKLRQEATIGLEYKGGGQGWYPGDTFRIRVDGVDVNQQNGQWQAVRVLEQGNSALVEGTIVHTSATVRLRFALAPDRDGVDVEVTLAQPAVKEFSITTACFPAYFTSWNKRRGDRWVVTPARSVEEPREPDLDMNARTWKSGTQHADLDPAKENSVFYYDRYFNDSAGGRGQGVCGLVFRSEEIQSAGLDVTDYQISTVLKAKPNGSSLRFTLWQSPVCDYGPALQTFPAVAAKARQRLADPLRFVPESIRSFDAAAETLEVERLQKMLPAAESGRAKAVRKSLETAQAAIDQLRKASADRFSASEEKAAAVLREYRLSAALAKRKTPHALRFLVLVGRDFPEWGFEKAAAALTPAAMLDPSYFSVNYLGDRLTRFPATEMEMAGYDGVIAVNISAQAFTGSAQTLLKEFVRNGGGLIVCGGFYAYGGGAYSGTVLEELLPVKVAGPFDVKKLAGALPVSQGKKVAGLPEWKSDQAAMAMWMHNVTVKPDAQVALEAGGWLGKRRPFMVVGKHGEGRVAALLGTVNGLPPKGKLEFWKTPQWTAYLSDLLRWVAGK